MSLYKRTPLQAHILYTLHGSSFWCDLYCRLYLQLQRVYREKADKDVAAVEAHVHAILSRLGKDTSSISSDTVRLYCKQARNLRLVRWVWLRVLQPLADVWVHLVAGAGGHFDDRTPG